MIDTLVSHYRITGLLGAGGMGEVYRADDTRLPRQVALKFLAAGFAEDELARSRFEREAQTAASLSHPNICAIYDIGIHQGLPYIVMELLSGQTLKQFIRSGPLRPERVIALTLELADALATAHDIGIIHRDIKASNIFVDTRGHAKLLDFGLAKVVQQRQQHHAEAQTYDYVQAAEHTTTGAIVGTMNYLSPEQARGEELDNRSDLFSLGIVMYEMAAGRRAFGGKTLAVTFDEILNKTPDPVCQVNPKVPHGLESVIHKLLEKAPDRRYQTAKQLLDDLIRLQGGESPLIDFSHGPSPESSDNIDRVATSSAGTEVVQSLSVAVLPFANLSGNAEHDYFGDGLADELITMLMKLKGVQVVSRTSAFQFKQQSLDVREIGRQLNATYVLEGSFRISGSRIRISANFINVGDGFQIWSDRFDRDMDDVFAVQDEIAQTIAGALEVTLTGRTQKPGLARATEHVEAYDHYLRGRFHWKKRTPDAIRKAIENFKEALEIDPKYAAAHAGLADCYAMLGIYAVMPRQVVMPQARAAAERALELDDSIAEAHSAIGLVAAIHDFDWATAESRFQKALTLAPDNATARYWYAMFVLLPNSRFEEALGQARWAADLDPVNPGICAATGLIYYMRGEHDRALEELNAALELEPTHPLSNIIAAYASIAAGRPDEALLKLKHCKTMRVVSTGAQAWAMLVSDKRAAAEEFLDELKQMSQQGNTQSDFEMARVYVGLGETELALDCLEKTYEQRSGALYWLNVNHYFDPLRSSPRFDELLKKLGLSG